MEREGRKQHASDEAAAESGQPSKATLLRGSPLREVQDVVSKYVNQMLQGCGDPQCTQPLCDNGRKNAPGRPIRRYTPRSARTIALTLASRPSPRRKLCPALVTNSVSASAVVEGPRDPASVTQLLADSGGFKQLCDPMVPPQDGEDSELPARVHWSDECGNAIRSAHNTLHSVEHLLPARGHTDVDEERHRRITEAVCKALEAILDTLPRSLIYATPHPTSEDVQRHEEVLSALDLHVQRGTLSPLTNTGGPSNYAEQRAKDLCDTFNDPRRSRMVQRCLMFLGKLCEAPQPLYDYFRLFIRWVTNHMEVGQFDVFIIWLKLVFLQTWETQTVFTRTTLPWTCLLLLENFKQIDKTKGITTHCKSFGIGVIVDRIDPAEMARTWLRHVEQPRDEYSLHLLDCVCVLPLAPRALYLRTSNHLRMQIAHDRAEKASALRARAGRGSVEVEGDARLAFLEDHYLLLSTGRTNVLSDSFDQIWQRRRGELLRPLRVRLGEMDAFEVGHDLGGVQIEFFNILCREVFSPEADMFNTDPATGLSYLRPGSLQPLYMFELFGMLFAIAIFNGITLPVSLPVAFYTLVQGYLPRELSEIRDAWPGMYQSLHAIRRDNIPGLPYAFPLEANGVRLSITSFEQSNRESESPRITVRVAEATAIVHRPDSLINPPTATVPSAELPANSAPSIDLSTLDWPGWTFEPSPPSEAEAEITPENQEQYITSAVTFLTTACIAPQLRHFHCGLDRVLSNHYLRLLPHPRDLKTLVEGTQHLSIPDLRAATSYEGYAPQGPYISCFWAIVAGWPPERQKALLKFVTAAERLPAGGAREVVFKISRVGFPGAEMGLPTSSTCFGTLMLPKYPSREVLERKLTVAVEMGGEGFGNG